MNHEDLDAEFERIVAGWDIDAEEPVRRAPAAAPETFVDVSSDVGHEAKTPEVPESPEIPDGGAAPTADPAPPPSATGSGETSLTIPVAPHVRASGHVWRGSPAADDPASADATTDEEHFVPDDPDLPTAEDDPMFWAIVGGLVGGPLLLLYVLFFDRGGSSWWVVTGVTMIVVGFILLVLRGSDRDPFDDGSRV